MKNKVIVIIICLFMMTFFIFEIFGKGNKSIDMDIIMVEDSNAIIDNYYVYGTHFNMNGYIDMVFDDLKLVLYNGQEEEVKFNYSVNDNKTEFNISDKINDGYNLEGLKKGNYYYFLKGKVGDKYLYYSLKNNTNYSDFDYYTLSKSNLKVKINCKNEYNTFAYSVSSNTDKGVYDITIDAGHGGMDSGASGNGYNEKVITLDVALMLRDKLNKEGLKVNITRDEDVTLDSYGENGRAVLPNKSNSKYVFSIHLNSHNDKSLSGVEILTPNKIDYTLARSLADNIVKYTDTDYSTNMGFKMYNGVYTRVFDSDDVNEHYKGALEDGEQAYDVKKGISYYYMIREPGGSVTGAYVDGRNSSKGKNDYYNSNKGVESYIIELGYIISKKDVNNIISKKELYVEAIVRSILDYLKIS